MNEFHYVYLTTNLITGKQYIGDRTCYCKPEKDPYIGSGKPAFERAKKKYGKLNFKKQIIEFFLTRQEAFDAQEKYIKQYNTIIPNGYNISPTGGSGKGGKLSESSKNKIKLKLLGIKHSDERRKNISKSHIGQISYWKGKKLPKTVCKKISDSHKGKKQSEELIRKRVESTKLNPNHKIHLEKLKELRKTQITINNGIIHKYILLEELAIYNESGWIRGRIKGSKNVNEY